MTKMLEQFYNKSDDTYTIPAKYLTKKILKGIESRVDDMEMKRRHSLYDNARNLSYLTNIKRELWKDNQDAKIPLEQLDEVSLTMINWHHNDFTKNILQQGWISYKQYSACIKMVCRREYAPDWESDNDNHLYYGMEYN